MSKPAVGTALDTGNALYSSLVNVWAVLETSGTTLADSKGGNAATLPVSGAAIVPNSGNPYVDFTAQTVGATLASTTHVGTVISGVDHNDWYIAWGCTSAASGMICGDQSTSNFLWMTDTTVDCRQGATGEFAPSASGQTTYHDYFLSCHYPGSGGNWTVKLYQDGSLIATVTPLDGATNFVIDRLGNGYSSNTFGFTGHLSYLYLGEGYAGSATDATNLASDPYSIFATGSPLTAGSVAIVSHTATSAVVSGTACTGGTATYSYQFQRSPDNGSNAPTGVWSNVGSAQSGLALGVAPSNVSDSGLTQNTKYWYRYTVTDSAGSPATANASPVSVTTYTTATSYTLTDASPASGPNGVASNNFTVQAVGYLSGSVTVTPHIASITGTFSPSTATLGTGNNSSATFTLTPSSVGTGLVSTTNSGSLTDPGSVSYTSTSVLTLDLTTSIADNGTGTHAAAYIQVEGGAVLQNNGGTNSWTVTGATTGGVCVDGAVRFKGTISALDLHCYLDGSPLRLVVDGSDGPTATLANSSAFGTTSGLFTGLDSSTEHEYVLCWGGTGGMIVDKLIVTGTANTSALAARPLVAFYGDSITYGIAGPSESTLSWVHHIGRLLNVQVANRGIGSTYVTNQGSQSGSIRTGDITGIHPTPAIVHILYGVNDVANGILTGPFGTAYTTMLTALRSGLPGVPIVCEAILKRVAAGSDQDAFNAVIAAQVAALADALTVYRTGEYTNYDASASAGTLHPNAYGSPVVAAQGATDLKPFLPATPASGGLTHSRIFTGF